MIGYRYFFGFAFFSFLMSAIYIVAALIFMIAGHQDHQFVNFSLP